MHQHEDVWNDTIFIPSFTEVGQLVNIRGCTQTFPDWPPGARTANGYSSVPLCAVVLLLWVSLVSSAAIILCVCFSTRVYCCWFRYRFRPETF